MPGIIRGLKLELQARAYSDGQVFSAVGIARDVVSADGLKHLEKFGAFDETMSGRSWANIGILKYVFEDLPGPAATPQIILVERTMNARDGSFSVVDERVLARAVGLDDIKKWADQGVLVP